MNDENGRKLTDKEILKAAGDHISEACCFLFECESEAGRMLGVISDLMLKLIHVINNKDDVLIVSTSYDAYEQEKYEDFLKRKRIKLKTYEGKEVNNEDGV